MTIYEIDAAIESCYDAETGEFNEDKFNDLAQARDEKIEQLICFYKDVVGLADAIKAEEVKLKERREAEERKAESLKNYIIYALNGEKFKTSKAAVSYRKSKQVICSEDFVSWAKDNDRKDLLSYKEPTVSKTAVKAAIESGEAGIPAEIVENTSAIIK